MLRKLRLRQKNVFFIKNNNVYLQQRVGKKNMLSERFLVFFKNISFVKKNVVHQKIKVVKKI